ncbi:MAG: tRNA dihydrouridine(20/20a) synthase DusA [SAR86 cluster bacterium]|uniref:tRNA-dihydrouridine synthase n=1 Tax=SAR86 cluster bacterium TaxID=2030880 RepID=A0A368BVP5_9GAMM|nr:MAG: tRNA dihydrouridine(20/20a) synthase DusA [SAR86 cluster bacterium]
MMQCTDIHDRYLMRLITKKSFLYTEMVTTGAIIHGNALHQLDFNKSIESPVALQLGGSNPDELAKCSEIAESMGYDEINLNLGCPSERVQKGSFGACLMIESKLVQRCLNSMKQSVSIPVTAKCRTGIDKIEDYDFLRSFVEGIANQNIATIIIHARNAILKGLSPRQNRTIPPLKYEYVYRIKEDFPELEIIINGGIGSLIEAKNHLQKVDGVMLGRAPYDNPMMLEGVDSEIFGEPKKQILRLDILKEYLNYLKELDNPNIRLNQVLKHIYGLNKGLKNARKYRYEINQIMKEGNLSGSFERLSSYLF